MKNQPRLNVAALTLLLLTPNFQLSTLLAQGSLTPPGAPAPTMKSLAQIEPRTPISALPFTITSPGSYYLTSNLTGTAGTSGVTISAHGVTLDLNGFDLLGVAGSSNGVNVSPLSFWQNVVIRNGSVRGWGGHGVSGHSDSGRIENIVAANNGGWGIQNLGGTFSTHIRNCEALQNGGAVSNTGGLAGGDATMIVDCQVVRNTGIGIQTGLRSVVRGSTVSQTFGFGGSGGDGMMVANNSVVQDCISANNISDGLIVGAGTTVRGCTLSENSANGLTIASNCYVLNNTMIRNGSNGIASTTFWNRIEGNHIDAGAGFAILSARGTAPFTQTDDVIVHNSVAVTNNTTNTVGAFGPVGPFFTPGINMTNVNPHLNYLHP